MAYDSQLVNRVRAYLIQFPNLEVQEKKMFGGLAFIINDKMCINVSGDQLMCRFDPEDLQSLIKRKGFLPMIMKGKEYKGYCYVERVGFENKNDFVFWVNLCLDFNKKAKSSRNKN